MSSSQAGAKLDPGQTVSGEEQAGVAAAFAYQIVEKPTEQSFDDVTRLAAHLFRVPYVLISLFDNERLWIESHYGADIQEFTCSGNAFCELTLQQRDILEVPDTHWDVRFANHPFVTSMPHIRFYAGVPLLTPEGQAVGTLCLMDRSPRRLVLGDREALWGLSRQVMTQLKLRQSLAQLEREVLERIAAQANTQCQFARLAALRAIDEAIISGQPLAATMKVVVNQVVALLSLDAASILVRNADTGRMECLASEGIQDKTLLMPPDDTQESLAGRAAAEGQRKFLFDLEQPEHFDRADLMRREGFVDYGAIPLTTKGETCGILEIYQRHLLQPTPDWHDFLASLVGQAAIAIDNDRLFCGLQRSNRE
ncbi:MAG TPA: GAF domain-containing protein, partial [Chthonomonadaceae bacterium]|nr:GAF domain-containing protein [Chthonomonadaceae bacterium]